MPRLTPHWAAAAAINPIKWNLMDESFGSLCFPPLAPYSVGLKHKAAFGNRTILNKKAVPLLQSGVGFKGIHLELERMGIIRPSYLNLAFRYCRYLYKFEIICKQ